MVFMYAARIKVTAPFAVTSLHGTDPSPSMPAGEMPGARAGRGGGRLLLCFRNNSRVQLLSCVGESGVGNKQASACHLRPGAACRTTHLFYCSCCPQSSHAHLSLSCSDKIVRYIPPASSLSLSNQRDGRPACCQSTIRPISP